MNPYINPSHYVGSILDIVQSFDPESIWIFNRQNYVDGHASSGTPSLRFFLHDLIV